jgi:putative ABC transport system permease protein
VGDGESDPLILGGVAVLLVAVAVIACVAPARRAALIDPMDAVRHE